MFKRLGQRLSVLEEETKARISELWNTNCIFPDLALQIESTVPCTFTSLSSETHCSSLYRDLQQNSRGVSGLTPVHPAQRMPDVEID